MDAIISLDICLDTSDRKFYYDYMHSAIVTSPNDAEHKEPEGRGTMVGDCGSCCLIDAYDHRMAQLAAAHFGKKTFETFAPSGDSSQTSLVFGSASTYQILPIYVLPLYQPGETVKGAVVMNLQKTIKAESLTINLLGRAAANYRIRHRNGYYDQTKYQTYIDQTIHLWQSPKASRGQQVTNSQDLMEGRHELPFEFTIPLDGNSSVLPLVPGDNFCYISYRLKTTVSTGKLFGRGNAVKCSGIWVNRHEKFLEIRDSSVPINVVKQQGGVVYRVSLPKAAFYANAESGNEVVPVTLEIDNSGCIIDQVSAHIRCAGKGMAGCNQCCCSTGFQHDAVAVREGPISPGQSPKFHWELKFDFSQSFLDSCNLPADVASDRCTVMSLRYQVVIKAKRSGAFNRNVTINIPFTVCTHNTSANNNETRYVNYGYQ